MAEWWKNITDALARPSDAAASRNHTATLKERLDREKVKLREQELQNRARSMGGPNAAPFGGPDASEAAQQEDLRALRALLGWKLGVTPKDLPGNPSKIDGYWFGVRRYITEKPLDDPARDGASYEPCWKLHFFRQCPQCRFLFPTLELGDYSEALEAAKEMMAGKEAEVSRSTEKLAVYLNALESGKPDEHCPRYCPSCRKLIRGGTL